jgi:cytochrome c oxidase subunit II
MHNRTLIIALALLGFAALLLGGVIVLSTFMATGQAASPTPTGPPNVTNGKSIYDTGKNLNGDVIVHIGGPLRGNLARVPLPCMGCHGPQGHGGIIGVMFYQIDVPDITWAVLTSPAATGPDRLETRPAYTEQTVKIAITEGINSSGNQMDPYSMPRYSLGAKDLNDLVGYLKTLH